MTARRHLVAVERLRHAAGTRPLPRDTVHRWPVGTRGAVRRTSRVGAPSPSAYSSGPHPPTSPIR